MCVCLLYMLLDIIALTIILKPSSYIMYVTVQLNFTRLIVFEKYVIKHHSVPNSLSTYYTINMLGIGLLH